MRNKLAILNVVSFCRVNFFVAISFLFYTKNGILVGDFFLIQGIVSILTFLLEILLGYISDLFSKRNILISCCFLSLLRVILWYFFSGFEIILIGEILNSISVALYNINLSSYIHEYLLLNNQAGKDNMLKKFGKNDFFISINTALCAFIGSILYGKFGYKFILLIESVIIFVSVILLLHITKIAPQKRNNIKIGDRYKEFIKGISDTLKNKKINYNIFIGAILGSSTVVLANNFQPLMKYSMFAPFIFGVVYFINYFFRGLAGIFVPYFTKKFSINKIMQVNVFMYIVSFALLVISYIFKNKYLSLFSIIFSCLAIFFQLIYHYMNIKLIYNNVSYETKTLSTSIYYGFSKLSSFIFLTFFKLSTYGISIRILLMVFLIMFIVCMKYLTNKVYKNDD